MRKGFTLIELLIAVLIIGILAAVAVPQYTTAVNKSRYAGLVPIAHSVKNAEEVVHMNEGEYVEDWTKLDIGLPGEVNVDGKAGVKVSVVSDSESSYVKAKDTRMNNSYVMYFDWSKKDPKSIHCEAKTGDDNARRLCLNVAGDDATPVSATESGYEAYVIEGSGTNANNTGGSSRSETWSCDEEGVCSGEDEDGVSYRVHDDGGTVEEEWTETNGTTSIRYWGQCYDDEVDENYRCTSHSDFERYVSGQDGYEVCCGEQTGRTCSEWCEGE